jgi:hypothetical protein
VRFIAPARWSAGGATASEFKLRRFLKQITFSNFLFPPLCKYQLKKFYQLKNSIKPTQTTRSKEEVRIKETKYLSKTVWNGSACSSFHDSEAGVVVIV